jgi:hypothetical protein
MRAVMAVKYLMISMPDHCHVPMAIAAIRAGEDVAIAKPINRPDGQSRSLRKA